MLQTNSKRYDLEDLLFSNESYNDEHTLTHEDVDMVNEMVERIESSRCDTMPKAGDRLLYTSKHGDFSPEAFIEQNQKGELFVCIKPMIPFVLTNCKMTYFAVSEGPFTGMHESKLEHAGTIKNQFYIWGHKGACANGAICFQANVNMWEYSEPEPLFLDFTTKSWRKITLRHTPDPAAKHLYEGDGLAFDDEKEYQNFLHSFCATVFHGQMDDQLVIWCYRDELKGLPSQEWEAINAPVTTRKIGTLPTKVKIQKEHEKHHVVTFYIHPE